MSASRLSQQFSDLFTYLLVPGLAVIVPAHISRGVLRRVSCWEWFLKDTARAALEGAREFVAIEDETAFRQRWKQVELLDARDLYMMSFGRTKSVLNEVRCDDVLEVAKDRAIIGMHWGPSISILKLLRMAGLDPAIPYRPPERRILRIRPFYYLFSILAARYIVKTMGERAVAVGGAGKALSIMLDQPGSVIVIMDAPPMEGRRTLNSQVLGKDARFNAGFPEILADKKKEYVFYAISLQDDGSLTKKLELEGPYTSEDAQDFLHNYAGFLQRHLSADPAQWRIWQVAPQFWN